MTDQSARPPLNLSSNRRVIQIFVASPGDVQDSAEALRSVVDELNKAWHGSGYMLEVLDWKNHAIPWLGQRPEPTILEQIPVNTWDVFIGVLWTRFGTPTGELDTQSGRPFLSGTEEEFTKAYNSYHKSGKPKMLLFRCLRPIDDVKNLDTKQLQLVQDFFERFEAGGESFSLVSEYRSLDEFKQNARIYLNKLLVEIQRSKLVSKPAITGAAAWLDAVHLTKGNPFAFADARTDGNLPFYFHIAVPYYDEIAGKTGDPGQPLIIFGQHGIGKTALNRRIAYANRFELNERRLFVISYEDFSILGEKLVSGETITPKDHVCAILRAGISALAEEENLGRLVIPKTKAQSEELAGFIKAFGDELGVVQRYNLLRGLNIDEEFSLQLVLPDSYLALFQRFCRAINSIGYERVLIMVDCVDEVALLETDEHILAMLIPLIKDLGILESKEALSAFRFFLPTNLKSALEVKGVRFDKIRDYEIYYSDRDLRIILEQRLKVFSEDQIIRMAQLVEGEPPDLDDRLIQIAKGNPRKLINLCAQLISEHCRMPLSEDKLLIRRDVVEKVFSQMAENLPARIEQKDLSEELPTPIVAILLRYENATSTEQLLQYAFSLTQGILQYTVCWLLSLYDQAGQPDQAIKQKLRELLFNSQKPPSLGDWREALDRLLKVKDKMASSLVEPVVLFRKNKEVGQVINRLVELRNDFAHNRMTSSSVPQTHREVQNCVRVLIDSAEVLSIFKMAVVEGVSVQEDGNLLHRVRVYKGNVLIPFLETPSFGQNYPTGHLVLYEPKKNVSLDLWPFASFSSILLDEQLTQPEPVFYEKLATSQNSAEIRVQYVGWIYQNCIQTSKTHKRLKATGWILENDERPGQ